MILTTTLTLCFCASGLLGESGASARSPYVGTQDASVRPQTVHHENILGTSLALTFDGAADESNAAEAKVLAEIERLRLVMSGWDGESELSRLPVGEPVAASAELCELLDEVNQWVKRTRGAFHPGVAAYTELWRRTAAEGRVPTAEELTSAGAGLTTRMFDVKASKGLASRLTEGPLSLDGAAKGFILDAAAKAAQGAGIASGVVDIGGDVRIFGSVMRKVAVADPLHPADNAAPLLHVVLGDSAIATSGGYARGWEIAGQRYHHILDPKTGQPVDQVIQATVVAKSGLTADVLATAFSVMDPRASLKLCNRQKGVETLILTRSGGTYASEGWRGLLSEEDRAKQLATSALAGGGAVKIDLSLAKIAAAADSESGGGERGGERGGRRGRGRKRKGGYKRPYVAVWIEDGGGKPVRTLTLWIERDRWINDLREWSRLFDHESEPVTAVTRATRGPGEYSLAFDGRDHEGNALPAGTYTLLIEASREHGTYQLQSHELVLDGRAFHFELDGGTELGKAVVDYSPESSK